MGIHIMPPLYEMVIVPSKPWTLFEYYNINDDSAITMYGVSWYAQTFTPLISHKIKSVKLLLYRVASPGTITVSIKATSGGHPIGSDLCVGTTNGDTLPTGLPYEWREIGFGISPSLVANEKYAIVVRALEGDGSNTLAWCRDATDPTYDRGNYERSPDSGDTWFTSLIRDFMFEDWGK